MPYINWLKVENFVLLPYLIFVKQLNNKKTRREAYEAK